MSTGRKYKDRYKSRSNIYIRNMVDRNMSYELPSIFNESIFEPKFEYSKPTKFLHETFDGQLKISAR